MYNSLTTTVVDSLITGSTKYFQIRVYSETEDFVDSEIIGPIVILSPPTVTNMQFINTQLQSDSSSSATFSWNSTNQYEYKINVFTDSFSEGTTIFSSDWIVSSTQGGTIYNLPANIYFYDSQVLVRNSNYIQNSTTDGTFTSASANPTVSNIYSETLKIGNTARATLSWESTLQTTARVRLNYNGGYEEQIVGAEKTVVFNNLLLNTTYTPIVTVYNDNAYNSPSATLAGNSFTTPQQIIPTILSFSLIGVTQTQASFSWSATNQNTASINIDGVGGSNNVINSSTQTTFTTPPSPQQIYPGHYYTAQLTITSSTLDSDTESIQFCSPPLLTSSPSISGTQTPGSALFCSSGSWSYDNINNNISYIYQWQRSFDNISWSNISGATSSSYTLTNSDADYYVSCIVSARVNSGSVYSPYISTRSDSRAVGPATPGAFTLSYDLLTSNSVRLLWTNSSYADSYIVRVGDEYSYVYENYNSTSPQSVTGLISNTNYTAQVTAVNNGRLFGAAYTNSNAVSFTTQNTTPAPPFFPPYFPPYFPPSFAPYVAPYFVD